MIERHAKTLDSGSGRLTALRHSAYRLRQHSIRAGGDIEGWQLARRMRDAESGPQAIAAEHEFRLYMRAHALEAAMAA